jgi:hypothetical protein
MNSSRDINSDTKWVIFNRLALVPILKQMTHPAALIVVPVYKSPRNSLKYEIERLLAFFNEKMNVVSHQAVSIDLISTNVFVCTQCFEEFLRILSILKYGLFVDSAQYNVIDPRCAFLPCLSWHG